MQPGALFLLNADFPYRGFPQDGKSFATKFFGFASPPHDGFDDKYSIVMKENLQAIYAAHFYIIFLVYTPQNFLSSFFANCGFPAHIVVFCTAHAFEKPTKCETQQTATIATISTNAPSFRLSKKYEVIKSLSDEYSISILCEALKVTKGSYYNHILRNKHGKRIF